MKAASSIFLVLGAFFLVIPAFNASKAPNIQYLIGTFLPGLIFVIIGLTLGKNEKPIPTALAADETAEITPINQGTAEPSLQFDRKRTNAFKRNASLGIIGGIVLMFVAGSIAQGEQGPFPIAWLVSLTGFACVIWGCVNYMRWKGYSGWFGFFGYLLLLGLVILVCFPNRRKRILQRHEPEEIEALWKQDRRRGFRFLLTLTPLGIFGIIFGGLIFFASSNIDAAQWKEFAPEGMGFQALMPGTPQLEQSSQETPAGPVEIRKFTVWTKAKSEFFMVVLARFPEDVGRQIGDTQKLLEAGRQDILIATQGQIRSQRSILLNRWPGLELEISTNGSIVKARIFATKAQIYEVWVNVPKIRSTSEDIQKFLDSFRLTEARDIEAE
jgi:hypothetical protein